MPEAERTVLVVDDEASWRELLGGFVESLGFRAESASSAEEALELIRRSPPDMVLLDVRMPGMSGIEALAEFAGAHGAAGGVPESGPPTTFRSQTVDAAHAQARA